ncbi:MAG: pyridoxal phosphate-dependent aminotransferase [Myxococcota bacterium]
MPSGEARGGTGEGPAGESSGHAAVGPPLAPGTQAMPGAVYSPFADQIASWNAEKDGPLFPLHVGDTWRDPFVGARSEDIASADVPRLHAYGDTRGIPALVEAVGDKLLRQNGLDHGREEILVTAGATGGLSTVAGATLSPGDEILILAPFWPLIRGIAQSFRATPVEVPFFDRVATLEEAVAAVAAKITSKSRVLYISTPSNPTGRIIPGAWLEALAALARKHDLWIFSDEVYEEYVYAGNDAGNDAENGADTHAGRGPAEGGTAKQVESRAAARGEHVSIARFAPERTVSVYSVSKSYAMAGQRVGYLAGPERLIAEARKIGTHLYYHAPIVGQHTALSALRDGADWVAAARAQDRSVGASVAKLLGQRIPEGGTFMFLDVRDKLDERGIPGLLEDCFRRGVLVAPGISCGRDYGEWIRLSYTAAPGEAVLEAASRLSQILGER